MADGDRLTGGSGSGRCGGSLYIACTDAADKPTTNLVRRVQLSPGERAGPGDERPRAVVSRRLSLKEPQNPLRAVGGPCGDKTSVGFA